MGTAALGCPVEQRATRFLFHGHDPTYSTTAAMSRIAKGGCPT